MPNKMTPTQLVVAFAAGMVVIFTLTAIAWIGPDSPMWVDWLITVVLVVASMILIYKVWRKTNPPVA